MGTRRTVRVVYDERSELDKAWRLYIKHGALVAQIHPAPATGDRLAVTLHPGWGGDDVHLSGTVAQASASTTVLQLEPLDLAARGALVLNGIADAAPAPAFEPAAEEHDSEDVEIAATVEMGAPTAQAPEPLVVPPPPEPEPVAPEPQPIVAAPPPEPPPPEPEPVVAPPPPEPEPVAAPPPTPESAGRPVTYRSSKPVRQRSGRARRPVSQSRIQAVRPPTSGQHAKPPDMTGRPGEFDASEIAHLGGPVSIDTEAVLPPIARSGDLSEDSWRDVLLDLFVKKATGVVVIHAFRENRWCYLVNGSPVHYLVDHAHPGEYLADALMRAGVVSGKQWTEALTGSKISGVHPGEYLVLRGIATQAQINTALQERAAAITRNLLTANFGTWSYHPWPPIADLHSWPPVELLPLLLRVERANMARMTDEEITKETEPHLDLHVSLTAARRDLLPLLPLQPVERTLATDLLPGGWTMKEMLVHGGLREKDLLRFIWVLRTMGFVELRPDEGDKGKRNRAERTLFVALKDILRRSDFEAIHCHWTAVQSEVEHGHKRILEEFGKQRFAAVMDARLEELITKIHVRADEALQAIGTKAGRDEIRKRVVGESQLIMAAELMLKQADMELYKGNFGVAKVCYERVIELAPIIHETKEARSRAKEQLRSPELANALDTMSHGRLMAVGAAIDDQLKM